MAGNCAVHSIFDGSHDDCPVCREIKKLEAKNKDLRKALQALLDEQNGPPLIRNEKAWQEAVTNAYRVL